MLSGTIRVLVAGHPERWEQTELRTLSKLEQLLSAIRRIGDESDQHIPRKANGVRLAEMPKPALDQVPNGRGFGRVEAVGPKVTEVKPVRRGYRAPAGQAFYALIGTNDMTTDDTYYERGINLRHGYFTEDTSTISSSS